MRHSEHFVSYLIMCTLIHIWYRYFLSRQLRNVSSTNRAVNRNKTGPETINVDVQTSATQSALTAESIRLIVVMANFPEDILWRFSRIRKNFALLPYLVERVITRFRFCPLGSRFMVESHHGFDIGSLESARFLPAGLILAAAVMLFMGFVVSSIAVMFVLLIPQV